jgi:hypothetical protein
MHFSFPDTSARGAPRSSTATLAAFATTMVRPTHSLPLDGFEPRLLTPNALRIESAEVTVDDESWGCLQIEDAQRRLVAAGDFAIVELVAGFSSEGTIDGLGIEMRDQGQRNLTLDGGYLVPSREGEPGGARRYRTSAPLAEGEHLLAWSFAWNPPADAERAPGPEDVVLAPVSLLGSFLAEGATLRPLPATVDLRDLARLGGLGRQTRLELSRTIHVVAGSMKLHLEGPPPGLLRIFVDGRQLTPVGDAPYLCPLPLETEGDVKLTLVFDGVYSPVRGLRLLP